MAKNDTVAEATLPVDRLVFFQDENSQLKIQIAALQDENSKLSIQVAALQEEIEVSKPFTEALEADLTSKNEELAVLRKAEDKSSVRIDTAKKATPSVPTETFDVEGKTYRFKKAAFIIGIEKHTAQSALENDALLVRLVDYPSVVEEI